MNTKELIAKLTTEHADVAPAKVKAIIKATFDALHAALESTEEGKLNSPLGMFRISNRPAKDGSGSKRRIGLRLAKAKDDTPDSEEAVARRAARQAERQAAKTALTPEERAARRAARKAAAAAKTE